MINTLRTLAGATIGATVAGIALRVHREAVRRDVPITEVLGDLPEIVSSDVTRIRGAAAGALRDGQREAARVEHHIEEVIARPRQTREPA